MNVNFEQLPFALARTLFNTDYAYLPGACAGPDGQPGDDAVMECKKMEIDKTVYIETSVVSHLTGRPQNDMFVVARQIATTEWWDTQSTHFELCTSAMTIEEAERVHAEAAARRLEALDGMTMLPITDAVDALVDALIHRRAVPSNARNDAVHIVVSAVHNIAYLLTWKFRHIANAVTRPLIGEVCEQNGYRSPVICTPNELLGGHDVV